MQRHPMMNIASAIVLLIASATMARAALVEVLELPVGAHPFSVAPQKFGKIWYSSQGAGALGIIDPATGEVEQIEIGENSVPQTVLEGPDRVAWIVDSGLNSIVRVDPGQGEVKGWPLPDDRPNSGLVGATFDKDGKLWFTGEAGIYGRFDPQSHEMQVFDAPGGDGLYGITVTPDGDIYAASPEGNHIAKLDRATGEAQVIEPPTPDQGARDVAADTQGRIWVSEENSGQISRYDPGPGEWKAWKVPGGSPHPFAIHVNDRDVVWLSDLASNEVHVFDATKEEFVAKYPSSHEGAEVHQINGGLNEIWLPEWGLDRLMLIRPGATGLY